LAVEDFNSNGKQDIIVGEPWATQTQGYLYVIYDDLIDNYSGTGNNIGMSDVANYSLRYAGDGDSNFIYSEDPKYGFVVDINGDGKVDLAPSNYYATFDSKHNVGSVYIIYNFPHAFSLSPVSSIITSNYLNISGVVDATLNSLTNISGVEYSLDSNDPSGVWVSCNATDGMFNGKIESFSCSLSSLAEAAHTVYIRAYDRNNSYTAQSHYASDTFIVNTHGAVLPPLPLAGSVNNQNNNNPVNTNTPTNTTPAATNGTSNSTNVTTPIASMLDDILSEAKILAAEDTNQLLSHLGIGANVANEQAGLTKYKTILDLDKTISANSRMTINDFIVYGTLSTKHLGAGERAAVINSYYRAYSRLPDSEAEWSDALKIANGRWPSERNTKSEAQAKLEFKKVYARDAVMSNNIDENAIMIIAYGLMPLPRNLNNERIAITTFRWVYGHNPVNALAWNIVRAIAYGGAGR
jgi:hypothetical protein